MEIGRERSAPSLFVKRREVATLLHAGGGAPLLKDLPVLGAASALASCALLAAQRQDRYAEPHGAPPAPTGHTPEPVVREEAERLGLDRVRLRRDTDDSASQARIRGDLRPAQAPGVQGTPALVIGDTPQGLVAEAHGGRAR